MSGACLKGLFCTSQYLLPHALSPVITEQHLSLTSLFPQQVSVHLGKTSPGRTVPALLASPCIMREALLP